VGVVGYSPGSKSPKVSLCFSEITTLFLGHSVFLFFLGNLVDTIHILGNTERWVLVVVHAYLLVARRQLSFGVGDVGRHCLGIRRSSRWTQVAPAKVFDATVFEFDAKEKRIALVTSSPTGLVFDGGNDRPANPVVALVVRVSLVGNVHANAVALGEPLHIVEERRE
jgi:hypothetical protein